MNPHETTPLSKQIEKAWIKHNSFLKDKYSKQNVLSQFCQITTPYKLLRVTAVLTARDDGSQALGRRLLNDKVIPMETYLRNPDKHKTLDDNYIKDWIELANLQLLYSGADFGLDVELIKYDLVEDTTLHERVCGDGKHESTLQFIDRKIEEQPSLYQDRVIIIFRWGTNPNRPTGQGCASVTSLYILMPGKYREEPLVIDGHPVFGNNHLTHELGHFMGLVHPFPGNNSGLTIKLIQLAELGNPKNLPFTVANLPEMEGVSEQDIQSRKQQALNYIATWKYTLEQDTGGDAEAGIPSEYGIQDTPVDLGPGLPLLHGQISCQGSYSYTFQRYHSNDLQEVKDANGKVIWWEPKPGAVPTLEDYVSVNDTVRKNVMNYWNCNLLEKRFSSDQVKRMHYVLEHQRAHLVGRVKTRTKCWMTQVPILVKLFVPPWEPRILPDYPAWDASALEIYLQHLEESHQLDTLQPATTEWLIRSANENI